jgi:two-component system sensor histidine kinase YcbA
MRDLGIVPDTRVTVASRADGQSRLKINGRDVRVTDDIAARVYIKVEAVYPLLVIINNLVANAIEAVLSKGYVNITSKEADEQLVIEVIDNGVGISEDEQEVIFEPGYTSKFDEFGKASTGIGLSHVKTMVKELNGTLRVASSDNGTSFTIQLPIRAIQAKRGL